MVFQASVPLRWGDMDAYRHCNNAAFITYLEQARVHAFHSRPDDNAGVALLMSGVVVVEHTIRYRRQVPYSPVPLRILLWTDQIRSGSYTTAYQIWNDSGDQPELAATAQTILAPINFASGRPRRLTDGEKTFLRGFGGPPD